MKNRFFSRGKKDKPKPLQKTATKAGRPAAPSFDPKIHWYYAEGDYREYPLIGGAGSYTRLPDGWEDLFFERLLRHWGNASAAYHDLGVLGRTIRKHRENNPEFAELWDDIMEEMVDAVEGTAFERAVQKADVQLIKFILSKRRKEVYGDTTKLELSGPNGGPILSGVVMLPHNEREVLPESIDDQEAYHRFQLEELERKKAEQNEIIEVEVKEK